MNTTNGNSKSSKQDLVREFLRTHSGYWSSKEIRQEIKKDSGATIPGGTISSALSYELEKSLAHRGAGVYRWRTGDASRKYVYAWRSSYPGVEAGLPDGWSLSTTQAKRSRSKQSKPAPAPQPEVEVGEFLLLRHVTDVPVTIWINEETGRLWTLRPVEVTT